MKNNTNIWDQGKDVPDYAKTIIEGGKLKNKTAINPVWRIKKLTEIFGAIGTGWNIKIINSSMETFENIAVVFMDIELTYKIENEWSEAIPGQGAGFFVKIENGTPTVNKECYKSAFSDALSVACKLLGIGTSIYLQEKCVDSKEKVLERIKKVLNELAQGNKEQQIKLLEVHTEFKGRDGKTIAGLNSFEKLLAAEKRLYATYGNLKKLFPDIIKKYEID